MKDNRTTSTLSTASKAERPRRIARLLSLIVLTFAGVFFVSTTTAVSASAANCAGTLVKRSFDSAGELVVYYSPAGQTSNCVRTNHLGSTYGVYYQTSADIWKCAETSPSSTCYTTGHAYDYGNFAYYAGPATVTGTAHRCIAAAGTLGSHDYLTSPFATACG